MRLLAFRSREMSRPHLLTKCARKSSFAAMFRHSPKKHPKMAKNSSFLNSLFKVTFYIKRECKGNIIMFENKNHRLLYFMCSRIVSP